MNYTTTRPVNQSLGEIQGILRRAGARSILTEFDDDDVPSSVSFTIETSFGKRGFRLPANVDKCLAVLLRNPGHQKRADRQQAARVAWRIIKDWLEAQLALIQTEMVGLDQVMLPYMTTDDGQTIYEALIAGAELTRALPPPSQRYIGQEDS